MKINETKQTSNIPCQTNIMAMKRISLDQRYVKNGKDNFSFFYGNVILARSLASPK